MCATLATRYCQYPQRLRSYSKSPYLSISTTAVLKSHAWLARISRRTNSQVTLTIGQFKRQVTQISDNIKKALELISPYSTVWGKRSFPIRLQSNTLVPMITVEQTWAPELLKAARFPRWKRVKKGQWTSFRKPFHKPRREKSKSNHLSASLITLLWRKCRVSKLWEEMGASARKLGSHKVHQIREGFAKIKNLELSITSMECQ